MTPLFEAAYVAGVEPEAFKDIPEPSVEGFIGPNGLGCWSNKACLGPEVNDVNESE